MAKKEAVTLEALQQLETIYETYRQELEEVYRKAKPTDGLFGFGDDPRKDPCHMRFYEAAERWVCTFRSREHEDAFAVVRYMLTFPAEHREEPCYWFSYAAMGLARELIADLTAQQCVLLREFYDRVYPRRERMPVQKQVYKLLKQGARGS